MKLILNNPKMIFEIKFQLIQIHNKMHLKEEIQELVE